jgi:hypothetical protein
VAAAISANPEGLPQWQGNEAMSEQADIEAALAKEAGK